MSVLLAVFSLQGAAFGVFPDVIQRVTHLALTLSLVYLTPMSRADGLTRLGLLAILGAVGAAAAIYRTVNYDAEVNRHKVMTDPEVQISGIAGVGLFDARRRTIGGLMVILGSTLAA